MGICPYDDFYVRNGQIALVAKSSGLSHQDFYKTLSEKYGEPRNFYLLGTTEIEKDTKIKHEYAAIFIKKVVAIGWNNIGNIREKFIKNAELDKEYLKIQYIIGMTQNQNQKT